MVPTQVTTMRRSGHEMPPGVDQPTGALHNHREGAEDGDRDGPTPVCKQVPVPCNCASGAPQGCANGCGPTANGCGPTSNGCGPTANGCGPTAGSPCGQVNCHCNSADGSGDCGTTPADRTRSGISSAGSARTDWRVTRARQSRAGAHALPVDATPAVAAQRCCQRPCPGNGTQVARREARGTPTPGFSICTNRTGVGSLRSCPRGEASNARVAGLGKTIAFGCDQWARQDTSGDAGHAHDPYFREMIHSMKTMFLAIAAVVLLATASTPARQPIDPGQGCRAASTRAQGRPEVGSH